MAHEELMRQLPPDFEPVDGRNGPFYIRNNGGSYSVVILNPVLVTCGGSDAKLTAEQFTRDLNAVWENRYATDRSATQEIDGEQLVEQHG